MVDNPLEQRPLACVTCMVGNALEQRHDKVEKAADMGVLEGHYNLGWMHEKGIGMPSNLSRAGELYRHVYDKAPSDEEALTAAVAIAMLNVKTLFLSAASMLMPSSGLEEVDTSQNNLQLAQEDMQGEADAGVHHDDFSAGDEGRDMQMQWDSILLLVLLLMLALVSLYWQRSREAYAALDLDADGPDGGSENDVPEERPRSPSSEQSFCVAPETE
ncbi:hypothetical protein CYMTET_30791 [Cymbomonas tetramitiformis]|uniref:Uncharacterized protein n=1 Tax=Cymbomonas tetramitiformis TaxID=36881 RepID=A0AAE0KTS3_9CHLO|nr:hypothetical protein CYMTET_30791 [Cymbomonas tetramitiformis]